MARETPAPSTLLVYWPWPEPPLREEVLRAAVTLSYEEEDTQLAATAPGAAWILGLTPTQGDAAFLIDARPNDLDLTACELSLVRWRGDEAERMSAARWLIAVETPLPLEDPLAGYHEQLRLCHAICPDAPAVYDASSLTLRPGHEVRRLAESRVPPTTPNLFKIHAVHPDAGREQEGHWLHTHGLARAGLPEIEIVGVPQHLASSGAEVINDLADVLIGYDIPTSEDEFPLGPQCAIAWRPWEQVAESLPDDALGGRADRDPDGDHVGRRIVLGSFGEAAGEPRSWRSPIDRLEFVYEHGGMHFRSERESHRRALRARESWPELAMLFVKQRGPEWEFQVKLCYEGIDEEGESVHEHLWFTLDEIKGDQLRATLFSSPRFIPALTAGQSGWHSVERLSDWTAHTPAGTFGPARAHELAEQFGGGAPVDNCSAEAAAPGELPPGFRWPFPDPPNAAALTMKSVVREGKPVLYVSHDDDDGTWQFLAGSDEPRTEDAMVVGLGEMIARDHGLLALADLPCGWIAWRTAPGQPWRRGRHP